MKDVEELREIGVAREDIYVCHMTTTVLKDLQTTRMPIRLEPKRQASKCRRQYLQQKGDELRNKFMRSAFKQEAEQFEKQLDEGKSSSSLRIMKSEILGIICNCRHGRQFFNKIKFE
ncbi:general stress protein [Bacillus licheniformis]|nr:general stress protein [Bacillus licheniformis]